MSKTSSLNINTQLVKHGRFQLVSIAVPAVPIPAVFAGPAIPAVLIPKKLSIPAVPAVAITEVFFAVFAVPVV